MAVPIPSTFAVFLGDGHLIAGHILSPRQSSRGGDRRLHRRVVDQTAATLRETATRRLLLRGPRPVSETRVRRIR